MKAEQIASIVNSMREQVTGADDVVATDLSNVVDVGNTILNALGYEQFMNTLVDKIGETVIVKRPYASKAPDIINRDWGGYGSIMEKIRVKLPVATTNDSWPVGETWTAGAGWSAQTNPTNDTVSPFITVRPEAEATYFNGKVTFEIDMTFSDLLLRSAMKSAAELTKFVNAVENRIAQAMTVYTDSLTMATIDNAIGERLASGTAVYDLLGSYNLAYNKTLTAAAAMYDAEFLRYAGYVVSLFVGRMGIMSRLFNDSEYDTFTPDSKLRIVLLDTFSKAVETFMQSDTYHDNLVGLPAGTYSTVPFWQGSGQGYKLIDTAALNITTASGAEIDTVTGTVGEAAPVEGGFYVVGAMFDVEAAGRNNFNPRTTSQYNARKEQTTFFHKVDAHYYNDMAENFIVFTLGYGTVLDEVESDDEQTA